MGGGVDQVSDGRLLLMAAAPTEMAERRYHL